ncbi:MAG: glycosyltransferase family 4 protein [Geminicoccaceae bacterium]
MKTPRVAIDVRYAEGPLSGFGRFTWTLIEGLVETGPPEPLLLVRRPAQTIPEALILAPGLRWRIVDRAPYEPLGQWRLARDLRGEGIRVMVSPDCFAPLGSRLKQVITVHDIIPLRCPELLPRSAKGRFFRLWRQWLRLQIAGADRVLTVSEHARSDIAGMFPGTFEKVRTVYNAVPRPEPQSQCRPASGLGLGPAKLLYVGRDAPYKNIVGCVETVAALRRMGIDANLTIVGAPDPRYPEVGKAIARFQLEDRVSVTGHVDEATLIRLYREASIFLFLSRYEGFGLPPLEAMAQGVPVISSSSASLPEVLGDAAILVDPDNSEAAAHAVRRILESPDLARDLAERGYMRAALFTTRRQATMFWEAIAPLL